MPPNDRSLATSTDASLTLHGERGGGRGASVAQDFAGGLVGQRVTAGHPVHLSSLVGPTHHPTALPGRKGEVEILGLNRVWDSLSAM